MPFDEHGVIAITDTIAIREDDLQLEFVQASGPGGQNVNKVASAVQLRFDTRSSSLPEAVRLRLLRIANKRVGKDGILLIEAKRYRSQEQNRQDAIRRLVELIRQASILPKERRKTRPSAASRQKRLEAKRKRSEVKRLRGKFGEEQN
jgi:ribosome-associated protein